MNIKFLLPALVLGPLALFSFKPAESSKVNLANTQTQAYHAAVLSEPGTLMMNKKILKNTESSQSTESLISTTSRANGEVSLNEFLKAHE